MNYKLAKQLKDARFSQEGEKGEYCAGIADDAGKETNYEVVYVPTLSELIDSCGDIILFKLPKNNEWDIKEGGKWISAKSSVYVDSEYLCASKNFIDTSFSGVKGKTPEEAVAKLWLELNKTQ